MSTPSSRIWPSVGRSNPAIRRSVVVFPQPEGPSSEKNSPAGMCRLTPSTAATSANRLTRSTSWTSPPAIRQGRIHGRPRACSPAQLRGRAPIDTATTRLRSGIPPLLTAYWTFGQYWGVWVVVFPEYLRFNGISEGEAGWQFGMMAAVSIVVMTLLAPRLQGLPHTATVPSALAIMGAGAFLVAYLPAESLWIAFIVLGFGNGLIDVFVNVAAQGIESGSHRPVFQWLHASYSVGGITGALGAGIAVTRGVSFRVCLAATGVLLLGAAAWNLLSPALARAERVIQERTT